MINSRLGSSISQDTPVPTRVTASDSQTRTFTPHVPSRLERLPLDAQENILSYLRLSKMISTIVNNNTRAVFTGIIPTAFKHQLEFRNSPDDPLTIENQQDYEKLTTLNPNPLNNIHHLNLRESLIDDVGLEALIRQYPHIQTLILSGCNQITDASLIHLQSLPLQYLDLCLCDRITDVGLANLEGLPLRHLDLCLCDRITDVGLANLEGLPLQYLNLSFCNQITDAGLLYLQRLPLQYLNLKYCRRITDAGLPHLQRLPLEYLDLTGCDNTSNEGRARLKRPGLPIVFKATA